MDDQSRQKMTQGITKAITDFGNIMSQGTKLKSQMLANTIKAKQNVLYKQMEQESQNKMILQNFKQMYENSPGEFEFEKPKLRQGGQGELEIYQPQPRDLEFSIKYNQRRIQMKQKSGMPLNEQEQRFFEKYPLEQKDQFSYDDELTQRVIGKIKTDEDFNEIIDKSKEYEKAGVNVKAIIQNFYNNPELQKSNPTIWNKLGGWLKNLATGG